MLTAPLKWHGGKQYLAKWIISHMPPRTDWLHYVEPYFGGGAVLLAQDPEGISEVANDLNARLITFWGVLASPHRFEDFKQRCEATPFSEDAYRWSQQNGGNDIETAWKFFIHCRGRSRRKILRSDTRDCDGW